MEANFVIVYLTKAFPNQIQDCTINDRNPVTLRCQIELPERDF